MIAAVLGWIKSKAGLILAGLLVVGGAVAAIFGRGRRQGQMEQKLAQEEAEDKAEAELAEVHRDEASRRREYVTAIQRRIDAVDRAGEEQKVRPPRTLSAATQEQAEVRVRLEKIDGVKK